MKLEGRTRGSYKQLLYRGWYRDCFGAVRSGDVFTFKIERQVKKDEDGNRHRIF